MRSPSLSILTAVFAADAQSAAGGRAGRHLFDSQVTRHVTSWRAPLAHARGGFEPNDFGARASAAGAAGRPSSACWSASVRAATTSRGARPSRLAEELNHGHRLRHHHLRVLPAHLGLRSPLREGLAVTSLLTVGGVLAVLLLAYLGFALLFPEQLP